MFCIIADEKRDPLMRDVRYGTIGKKKMERDLPAACASASASVPLVATAPRRAPNRSDPSKAAK